MTSNFGAVGFSNKDKSTITTEKIGQIKMNQVFLLMKNQNY